MSDWIQAVRDSRFFFPAIILGIGILISAGLYLSAPEPETKEIVPPTILVDAYRVSKGPLTMTVETQGEVRAKTRTTLVSEVSGVVEEMSQSLVAGGAFKKGDLLLRIDDRNYVSELERAEANVAGALTALAEEEGLAEFAIRDWEQSKMKGRPSDLTLRKPQIEEAKQKLEFAEAELLRTREDLKRTRVIAPYDGLVEERQVDLGQYLSPGTPLAVIFATNMVEVRLPIPLHETRFLELPDALNPDSKPLKVTLTPITGTAESGWKGELVRTEAVMDRNNRVLYAVAEVTDPYLGYEQPLRVGSYVAAAISARQFPSVAAMPRAAVRPGNKVWIINGQGELEVRLVDPIRADEFYLYVEEGIEDGEIVSITPLENPLPGMKVKFRLQNEGQND